MYFVHTDLLWMHAKKEIQVEKVKPGLICNKLLVREIQTPVYAIYRHLKKI